MTAKRFVLLSAAFTVAYWVVGVLLATLAAYAYAHVRGNLLPDGSLANGGPLSHWIGINFRAFLPAFLLAGSILGVIVGQIQLWIWWKQPHAPDNRTYS